MTIGEHPGLAMVRPRAMTGNNPGLTALTVIALCMSWGVCLRLLAVVPLWPTTLSGLAYLAAAGLMVLLAPVLLRLRFLATLSHEVSHALLALITGGQVETLVATEGEGGSVTRRGGLGPLVVLAPYCVPMLALALGLLFAFTHPTRFVLVGGLLGLAWGYHFVVAVAGMRLNFLVGWEDTDVGVYGPFVSLAWFWVASLATFSVFGAFSALGVPGVAAFWTDVGAANMAAGSWLLEKLHTVAFAAVP